MVPQSFDYVRANSIQDVVALLSRHGTNAKLLAGGHSLIPAMKLRLHAPGTLIDVTGIRELNEIKIDGNRLRIGSLATHHSIESSKVVAKNCLVLAEAASRIGDPQ
ncbi:xanthine dehydrogenase family protein subunit M, partial [Candidatus Parcubacteria bacterium]